MTAKINEIMVDLQGGESQTPLYEKIYQHIKNEISIGRISKGEKLPSTRLLAGELMVSRSTVELAYAQLLAEGYITSEERRGFFVCDVRELYQLKQKTLLPKEEKAEEQTAGSTAYIDFSPYEIDTKHFPYNVWRRIHKNILSENREELLLSGDGQGDFGLRKAIAGYLYQARGVNCSPNQILIGAGNEYLVIMLSQVLGAGKKVLMENPTYLQAYRTFSNVGYEIKAIPVAEEGMPIEAVRRECPDLIYLMPSHQFPVGMVLPLRKRLELLNWAAEAEGRYLVEDDHDSEYRYRGKPIPSLQSIDQNGTVIYLGTFSKSIAPSLRISYMVLPEKLLADYQIKCGFYSTTVPKIQQEVLREFILEGHFGRHLNKMRSLYKGKHDFLTGELKNRKWVKDIQGDCAGLHVLVWIDTRLAEEQLCALAFEAGVKITGISQHYIGKEKKGRGPALLIGYGKLSEEEILKGLSILDEIL